MTSHQIVAIRKPDRRSSHEHITDVKYDGTVHTRESVIRLIENLTDSFYVQVGGTTTQVTVVYPRTGQAPYLRTIADQTGKDNLLSLPEC